MYISWADGVATAAGAKLPPFGKVLQGVDSKFIESMLDKAVNRFSKLFFETF